MAINPEDRLDETIEESFPASDPPANTVVNGIAPRPDIEKEIGAPMNDALEIKHQFDGNKGSFYIEQDGKRVAEMTYVQSMPTVIIIDHTGVSTALEGQGVGAKLVAAGVQHARENNWKVVPLCPFAKAMFERKPEYADVWYRTSKE